MAEQRRGTAGVSGAGFSGSRLRNGRRRGRGMLIKDPRGSWEGVPGGDAAVIAAGRCSAGKADRPNGLA